MADKILIVDDEANITSSFASLLGDEGYLAKSAASVDEALGLCANTDFTLVLLDLNMPQRSGLEFLRELRPPLRPEVLVISGQADIAVALEAIKLGALDYPGNVRQLKNIIERLTILHGGQTVSINDLGSTGRSAGRSGSDHPVNLSQSLQDFERRLIKQTLEQCQGNISEAARQLGTDRANLSRKVRQLRLEE